MAEANRNKWVVLALLTLVYTFSFIDRQLLVILAEPVKADLDLSDTQLGLLTGLAFAALYVTLGLPIARLADKGNRKNVVSASLAIWSAMTVLSGMVTSFTQMLLARIGVGIGEAGGSPPSHSIISDYFPPEKRATALSIYSVGIYIGIFLGFTIGGVLAQNYGWRVAFYAVGIPGILLAAVIYYLVKEPVKGRYDPQGVSHEIPTLSNVIKTLLGKKTFIFIALGSGFIAFGSYGAGNFLPSFLQRVHGVEVSKAGYLLGVAFGIGGGTGTFLGGFLADRLRLCGYAMVYLASNGSGYFSPDSLCRVRVFTPTQCSGYYGIPGLGLIGDLPGACHRSESQPCECQNACFYFGSVVFDPQYYRPGLWPLNYRICKRYATA